MTDTTYATLRAPVAKFKEMVDKASLDGDTEHSDLYLNILPDKVQILQSAPGEVVMTYCTFGEDWFDDIEVERDIEEVETTDNSGDDITVEVGAEAIVNVDKLSTYLGFAASDGTVELTLTGSEDRRLASYARADGALEAWVRLPGSGDILDSVPHWLPFRFNSDDIYTNRQGDPAPTRVTTNVGKVKTIIDAVDKDADVDMFPIVVEDGNLTIDVGDEQGSGVRGTLSAQSVEGPDVENYYHDGFREIFSVLGGSIELQTAPGNNPMAVVERLGNNSIVRHVNGSVNV